jgi:tetratricopeptide (TPR) repeat protein
LTNLEVRPTISLAHPGPVWAVAFSPDERWLATGSADQIARLWDLTNPEAITQTRVLTHEAGVSTVAFSPDGHWLATASDDATAQLWDLTNPDVTPTVLRGHEAGISAVAFSPDNHWLATASADKTARLWDLTDFEATPTSIVLRGHEASVLAVAFSPDKLWLLTGSADKTARLWPMPQDDLISQACQIAGRNLSTGEWTQFFAQQAPDHLTCPNLPLHPSFIEEGQALARAGDVEGALAQFQQVQALDPSLDLNPEAEVAQGLVEWGKELAQQGNAEGAIAAFQQAQTLDPGLDLNPETEVALGLVEWGSQLAGQGNVEEAIAAFQQAQTLEPTLEIAASSWGTLCRFGSLFEKPADVIAYCDRAVELAPDDGWIRNDRGVARALMGDYEGAIDDFTFFVDWSKKNNVNGLDSSKREDWIAKLQAGQNPFDAVTLEELRNE